MNSGMATITARATDLLDRIRTLESRYGRAPGSVTLVGISKTHPVEYIREAFGAGVRNIGESYLQEALPKLDALRSLPICWHFVGRIQANKTAAIAAGFDWVHSIDRIRVARRLNDQRPEGRAALECCIEVNLSEESGKGGVDPHEVDELADAVAGLPRLRLRGLMAIPAAADGLDAQRVPFARLAGCLERLRSRHPQMDTLSIGMSADMEAAIAEGATMVRIGTALFGPRRS